jgi:hypothetical protein
MKKVTNLLAAMLLLFSVSSFAAGKEEVSKKVKAAFEKDFASAALASSWEKNEDGELLAVSRRIESSQLPLSVTLALEKKYPDFSKPATATELNFEGQTIYYVTLENEEKALTLKCFGSGEISVDSKIKK